MLAQQLDSLADPIEVGVLMQQHVAVEVDEKVCLTFFNGEDAAQNRVPTTALRRGDRGRKVLPVHSTVIMWRVVYRGDAIHHSGLEQLHATRLQLLRRPDARPPRVSPP